MSDYFVDHSAQDIETADLGLKGNAVADEPVRLSPVPTPGDLPARFVHTVECARVPILACSPAQAVRTVLDLAAADRESGADVHLCNAYTLALADRNPEYRSMLRQATLNLADGKSVAWVNKWSGLATGDADRIRGNDLFLEVVDRGQVRGTRHYLLGGTDDVVRKLHHELIQRFPAANIVGVESPPFRPLTAEERQSQVQRICEAAPDVVWVGLGTPKQDVAAFELARTAGVVAVAIGAAFDFITGNKREAPRWMQQSGLEWVHRLKSEPRRLWRRYLFGNSRFIYAAYRQRSRRSTGKINEVSSPPHGADS